MGWLVKRPGEKAGLDPPGHRGQDRRVVSRHGSDGFTDDQLITARFASARKELSSVARNRRQSSHKMGSSMRAIDRRPRNQALSSALTSAFSATCSSNGRERSRTRPEHWIESDDDDY